jgi:hypothetical protein
MNGERDIDVTDALLKNAPTWEPPDGFVLRVIAASRADERRVSARPEAHEGLSVFARLRAFVGGMGVRRESTAWMLRQYWNLLRRP